MSDHYFDTVYHVYYSSCVIGNEHFGATVIQRFIPEDTRLIHLSSQIIKISSPDYFSGLPLIKGLDQLLLRLAKQVSVNRFEISNEKIIIHSNPVIDLNEPRTQSWLTYYRQQFPMMVISEEAYPDEVKEMLEEHLRDLVKDHQDKEVDNGQSTTPPRNET